MLKVSLNGWQRLWVVFSGFFLVSLVVANFPNAESIHHDDSYYERLSPEAKAQIAPEDDIDAQRIRMPNKHVIMVRKDVKVGRLTPLLVEYASLIDRLLLKSRIQSVGVSVGIWIAVSTSIYCVGFLIGWIRRGFKTNKTYNLSLSIHANSSLVFILLNS